MRLRTTLALCAFIAATLPAAAALAQDDAALLRDGLFARDRNTAVTQRAAVGYEPNLIRAGSFVVLPVIGVGVEANDNIFAVSTNTKSDTIFHVSPGVTAQSDWSRNALTAYANLTSSAYSNYDQENTTDFSLGTFGRLDIAHDLGVAAGASFDRLTEPRTDSASSTVAYHPIRYDLSRGYVEATKAFNRLRATGEFVVEDYAYDNASTQAGVLVYEKDRDHTTYSEGGRLEYAVSPDTSVFGNILLNEKKYRNASAAPRRDSDGYTATVGANFDLTHLARGEVQIGYMSQEYDSSAYKNIDGFTVRGNVQYFPTQLTTVTLSGGRGIEDAGILNVAGYINSNVVVQVDHELLRNFDISGSLGYADDDYQGYDREDKRTTAQVFGTYLLNRAMAVTANYTYSKQDSSGVFHGFNYTINRFLLSLAYKF